MHLHEGDQVFEHQAQEYLGHKNHRHKQAEKFEFLLCGKGLPGDLFINLLAEEFNLANDPHQDRVEKGIARILIKLQHDGITPNYPEQEIPGHYRNQQGAKHIKNRQHMLGDENLE